MSPASRNKGQGRGVALYLLLAYGLAWLIWVPLLLSGRNPGEPGFIMVILPGSLAPAVAAYVVRKYVTKEGFADAGLALRLSAWPYLVIAWLMPLGVALIVLLMAKFLGLAPVDLSFGAGLAHLESLGGSMPISGPHAPLGLILTSLAVSLPASFLLFGEEFGWRGYLQKKIFPNSPAMAAAATGLAWAFWHLPLNLAGYNFPGHPFLGMAVFSVSLILLSYFLGWLVRETGSLWPSCLAHSASNALGFLVVYLASGEAADSLWTSYMGILSWLPMGLLALGIHRHEHPRQKAAA